MDFYSSQTTNLIKRNTDFKMIEQRIEIIKLKINNAGGV